MKQEDTILRNIAATLIEDPKYKISIKIDGTQKVENPRLWDRLFAKPVLTEPIITELIFYPPYIGTMHRIAARALALPEELRGEDVTDVMLPVINDHMDDVLYIISAAYLNRKEEPDAVTMDMFRWGLKFEKIYELFSSILNDEDMQAFLNSITLVRGTANLLKPKVNPMDGSE